MINNTKDGDIEYKKMINRQWFAVCAILGVILLGIIYYFNFTDESNTKQSVGKYQQKTVMTGAKEVNIFTNRTDSKKGEYLTDQKGMTLYVFDKDTKGLSTCYGDCAKLWPPFIVKTGINYVLPNNVTTVSRTDGSVQYSRQGMPLYYYSKDLKPGDILGDGVGGFWHLIKP